MQQILPLFKRASVLLLMSLCIAFSVHAQTRITGKVVASDDKMPVIGASVKIKNSASGTMTDANGAFAIQAGPSDVLVISFIGYGTREVTVGQQKSIDVTLQSNSNDLTEVVVTGYTAQRKKDLTGSVAVVDVAQLKAQPAASAVEALQGKAPGVQIVNDGAPGSTPQIRIRGNSTINNNEPLYVVDGVPYEGNLNWLNQNDIESLQVLKDASSASIYGARANNGVVIITTKKGIAGPPKINLDAYVGISAPRKSTFPKMMNPQQYAQYIFDGYTNAGLPIDAGANYGSGSTPTLPEYLVAGGANGQDVTAADADPSKYNYTRDTKTFYQITKANKQGTNWFEEMTEPAPVQSYQLSSTGGSENATYAFTGGYLNQKGTIKNTGFTRYNLRSNTNIKKVRFGENAQYSYSEAYGMGVNTATAGEDQGEGSPIGWAYRMPTIVPVYDIQGNYAGSRGSRLGNAENPIAVLDRQKGNLSKSNFFFGNVFAEADIIDGLVARTSFGLRYENYSRIEMRYPNLEFSEGNTSNSLTEVNGYRTEWTWTNTLNYNKVFNEKHRLGILLGTEAIKSSSRETTAARNDFFLLGDPNYYYLNNGASAISNGSFGALGSLFSLFGRADYAYNDRYLASITVRRDGSSNFGPENKYGVFPAASVAWRISEEDFLKDVSWLTDLKFRAGYGETGNQRIDANQYLNRYRNSIIQSGYGMGGGNGIVAGVWQNSYANTGVKWESLKSLNLGVDFTLADGVFDGSFDWYNKKTSDMLYRVPLPATAVGGGTSPYVNIGDMSNKGVELALAYHYGRNNDKPFKFDIMANISRNVNKIVKLSDDVSEQPYGFYRSLTTSLLKVGESFGSFYGYKVAGIYQNADDVKNSPSYEGARVGGFKYADVNGDGALTPEDRTIIGDPNPDFLYSLGFNASYKNWDFAAFFNGSQGNDLYDVNRYFTDFPSFDGARSTRLLNAWSPSNPDSQIPSSYVGGSTLEYASSSYYVQNGSFFRMKNLQIGYSIPMENASKTKTGINKLRIYVSATNLFTITKYTGLDPEVGQSFDTFSAPGVDRGVYPIPRQFLIGVNLGF
ncbi:membrane protein [Pedobacter antarcticus 4BY]|uniref:Membrane protein n=2 Tax=Pedobacter antarcticus TaxID=34086 RepID=A0A081PLN1_9SPHI|nr:TonB-dependent receptor [Pedobacter antarcticus]KEQ31604.1 membrane protein [Pedobacter antarcticus 4BY]